VVRVFFPGVPQFPEKKLSAAYVEQSNVLTYLFDEFARRQFYDRFLRSRIVLPLPDHFRRLLADSVAEVISTNIKLPVRFDSLYYLPLIFFPFCKCRDSGSLQRSQRHKLFLRLEVRRTIRESSHI
jgi:hypothetical protein